MIALAELVEFLDLFFEIEQFGDDKGGIFINSDRPIQRIGFALEPWPGFDRWVRDQNLDAVFLHRPWQLQAIPAEIGVIFYHLAFDERLTMGFNLRLAPALGMRHPQAFGEKSGRPLGMIAAISPQPIERYRHQIRGIFGGWEQIISGQFSTVDRVAVVGALNAQLVEAAAAQDAQIYITGQLRASATAAIESTGIEVIAIGHRRCELWGLRSLAGLVQERFAEISVMLPSPKQYN